MNAFHEMIKVEANHIVRRRDEKRAIIRREIATAAMAGLLADHKDHEDERRTTFVGKKEVTETCAQAVARLAVEHADALLAELNQPTDKS